MGNKIRVREEAEMILGDSGGGPLRRARAGQCRGLQAILLLASLELAEEGEGRN